MKPKTITSRNGEKLRVSINRRMKIANFTTYYKDGKPCNKYYVALTDEDIRYYEGGASFSDWKLLLHDNCVLVR